MVAPKIPPLFSQDGDDDDMSFTKQISQYLEYRASFDEENGKALPRLVPPPPPPIGELLSQIEHEEQRDVDISQDASSMLSEESPMQMSDQMKDSSSESSSVVAKESPNRSEHYLSDDYSSESDSNSNAEESIAPVTVIDTLSYLARRQKLVKVMFMSNAQTDPEKNSFIIPATLILEREKEMQIMAEENTSTLENWNGSLLGRKLYELLGDIAVKSSKKERTQGKFCDTVCNDEYIGCMPSCDESSIASDGPRLEDDTYAFVLDTESDAKLIWSTALTEAIRSFYNTGSINVRGNIPGNDLLLALDFFGIVYSLDKLHIFAKQEDRSLQEANISTQDVVDSVVREIEAVRHESESIQDEEQVQHPSLEPSASIAEDNTVDLSVLVRQVQSKYDAPDEDITLVSALSAPSNTDNCSILASIGENYTYTEPTTMPVPMPVPTTVLPPPPPPPMPLPVHMLSEEVQSKDRPKEDRIVSEPPASLPTSQIKSADITTSADITASPDIPTSPNIREPQESSCLTLDDLNSHLQDLMSPFSTMLNGACSNGPCGNVGPRSSAQPSNPDLGGSSEQPSSIPPFTANNKVAPCPSPSSEAGIEVRPMISRAEPISSVPPPKLQSEPTRVGATPLLKSQPLAIYNAPHENPHEKSNTEVKRTSPIKSLKKMIGSNRKGKNKKSKKSDWNATIDPISGKTYYYHSKTKEVTWRKPATYDDP